MLMGKYQDKNLIDVYKCLVSEKYAQILLCAQRVGNNNLKSQLKAMWSSKKKNPFICQLVDVYYKNCTHLWLFYFEFLQ